MLLALINKLVFVFYGFSYRIGCSAILQGVNGEVREVDKAEMTSLWLLYNR